MSLKDTDVRTLGDEAIAKKFKLSLAKVRQLVKQGAKHEKEHNTNQAKAEEVARDHIGERPDYYRMLKKAEKTKVKLKEENGVGGVRGLGYVTGDPGVNFVDQYINTNAMSYEDQNGNNLEYIKKKHVQLHNKGIGFNFFDPTNVKGSKNFMNEGISAGPEREVPIIGDPTGSTRRLPKIDEGERLNKAKRVAMAGMTAANIYTLGDVMSKASSGHGSPKSDIVRAATTLPGPAGWGATGVHYAKKAYDYVKRKQMNEDKDPCWKGYEMVGMKKKGGRKVPNCVPKEQVETSAARYTERPTYEQSKYPETTERGIYQEGHIGFGHPYDWAGDRKSRKVYGTKPKEKPESNEPGTDDTYKGSKQGGRVKLVKKKIDEVAMSMPPNVEMPVPGIRRQAGASQQRLQGNTYRAGQSFASQGTTVKSGGARMGSSYGTMKPTTTDVKRNISNRFNPSFSQQGTGAMKASSVKTGSSFSQGGGQVAQKMSSSSPSQVVAKMSDAGRAAMSAASKAAPTAAKIAGGIARVAAGPAATAAAAVMSPTPAGEKKSEFQRQADVAKGVSYKAQGRSISDYEKQVLSPSRDKVNTTHGPGSTKNTETPQGGSISTPQRVSAPTPPERPQYFSRGQAFQAARGEAGGGEGKFSYDNKPYQTNVSGEKYKPASQLKQTSVQEARKKLAKENHNRPDTIKEPGATGLTKTIYEETKMENQNLINEAIENILENDLNSMKENLTIALQEKAMEKLEERKKEIAASYFAQ